MFVICAWCNKSLGEKEPLEDKSDTHGICKSCAKLFTTDDDEFMLDEIRQRHPEVSED